MNHYLVNTPAGQVIVEADYYYFPKDRPGHVVFDKEDPDGPLQAVVSFAAGRWISVFLCDENGNPLHVRDHDDSKKLQAKVEDNALTREQAG